MPLSLRVKSPGTLKTKALRSFEASEITNPAIRHIPADLNPLQQCRESLRYRIIPGYFTLSDGGMACLNTVHSVRCLCARRMKGIGPLRVYVSTSPGRHMCMPVASSQARPDCTKRYVTFSALRNYPFYSLYSFIRQQTLGLNGLRQI